MKNYSIQDYSCALTVIELQHEVDQFGNYFVNSENIMWANNVITFFTKLYNKARSLTGAWCARIKYSWLWIQGKLIDRVKREVNKLGTFIRTLGGIIVLENKKDKEYRNVQRSRAGKFRKQYSY